MLHFKNDFHKSVLFHLSKKCKENFMIIILSIVYHGLATKKM